MIQYIDDWEPSDEEDDLDEEELWEPVIRHMSRYPVLTLGVSFGVKDKEKEGWLEKIKSMSGKGILKIVLPPDCQVSEKRLPLLQAPSALSKNDTAHFQGISSLMDRLTVSEYGVRYFSHFEKIKDKDNFYELEYILYGKKTDRENLEASVLKLVSVRQGLNMIHILSDGKKRQEAETLAAAITGGGSLLPLTAVVTFFVMGVWALAEAMADARSLLDGGKVPLMKTGSDWKLSLENVLKTGAEGRLPDLEKTDPENEMGLDLKGYLRLFLFVSYGTQPLFRMMDIMQINIRREQPDFLLEQCVCMVDMEAVFCGKPVFFSSGPWKTAGKSLFAVTGSYLSVP